MKSLASEYHQCTITTTTNTATSSGSSRSSGSNSNRCSDTHTRILAEFNLLRFHTKANRLDGKDDKESRKVGKREREKKEGDRNKIESERTRRTRVSENIEKSCKHISFFLSFSHFFPSFSSRWWCAHYAQMKNSNCGINITILLRLNILSAFLHAT